MTRFGEAVAEIKRVCKKHNVVLVGTCYSEGIVGEISVYDRNIQDTNHPTDHENYWNFKDRVSLDGKDVEW